MAQGVARAIRETTERVSGSAIVVCGLALVLFTYESSRMSAFQNVQAQSGFLDLVPSAASVLTIIALLVAYHWHPTLRVHRHPLAGFSIAALFAISPLTLARGGIVLPRGEWVLFLARCVRSVSVIVMLACWMEALLPKRARDVAVLVSLSVVALAGLNVLSALFKEAAAHVLVAVIPFLSMACLYWHKDHETLEQASSLESADAYAALKVDDALLPKRVTPAAIAAVLLNFLVPLGCYSFVFGYMHYAWIPAQDGTIVSLTIQLAAALGTFVAGLVLLELVSAFWGRRIIELYNFFALSIMVLALCITALASGPLSFVYVVPLNIAQKMAVFFIWMAPFLVPHKTSALTSWCWALLAYQVGKLASSTVSSYIGQSTYLMLAIGFAGLLIAGSIAGLIVGQTPSRKTETNESAVQVPLMEDAPCTDCGIEATGERKPARSEGIAGSAPNKYGTPTPFPTSAKNDLTEFSQPQKKTATSERHALVAACSCIAKAHQLTRREEEVLQLLSEGMTAKGVAETLVVSSSTAKSHMRNIYAKLNIHTQNELILMVRRQMQDPEG